MCEELKDAYFTIDKKHSDVITIEDLENYRRENNLNEDFIQRWQKLFDPENTGVITLQRFSEVLGLSKEEDPEEDEKAEHTPTAPEEQPEILQIAEDMEPDKQKVIFDLVKQVEETNEVNDRDIVRSLKAKLDEKYGRLWHVLIVRGQYHAFYSYEGGNSFCFKKGPRIYIIFKTPAY
ncbi:Tegument antigen [Echinococcus granulosus]|uniref:Tegument antigen n=1 Tax=Echinococcus granulosus TaxID=6210 RepID=U6JFD4_ECHGR|nr:Tegument antigen [Echinococcus granulosus]EUB62098.1 Tegument antigen [Echinococcus granulosus]KAH9286664.1 Tegument antigen [Echinococcus granulosus]CDS22760.1 tegumental antigen [Echinococcus granulosus]